MTESDAPPAAAPDAPPPPAAGLVEDFVDIFVSPREVFARRANAGFLVVLVVLTLAMGGLFLANRGAMDGIMDAEMKRGFAAAMKQNPALTAEQLEPGRKFAATAATVGAFLGVPMVILALAFGAWLTARLLGGRLAFRAAGMIAAYAYLPRVLEAVAVLVQGLLLDTSKLTGRLQVSLGVGRFLDPDMSPGLLGLLGRIDLFTLWVTVLLAIGIVTVAKLPKGKTPLAGAAMWLFGALPSLWTLVRGG